MKNIINEKPQIDNLVGHTYAAIRFIEDIDIDNKKILDIGCGFGWLEMYLLEKKKPCFIKAIDIDNDNISVAKRYINNPKVDFETISALELTNRINDKFDTVIAIEVIEHIPKKFENDFFYQINKILKLNGTLYISTPNNHPLANIFDPAWILINHRHYNVNYLKNIALRNGFVIEKYLIRGGIINLIDILIFYFSKWILRRKKIFSKYLDKMVNSEIDKNKGFMNLSIKFRKVSEID